MTSHLQSALNPNVKHPGRLKNTELGLSAPFPTTFIALPKPC